MEQLTQRLGDEVVKIGLGPCMKNKWLKKNKDLIVRLVENIRDETAELLQQLAAGAELSEDDLKNLKRRKLVNQLVRKSYCITKGEEFSETRQKRYADITRDMLGNIEEVTYLIFIPQNLDRWNQTPIGLRENSNLSISVLWVLLLPVVHFIHS
jgi:hypothetical protein